MTRVIEESPALLAREQRILAGTRNPLLGRRVRAQAKRALGRLEAGLGGYASR